MDLPKKPGVYLIEHTPSGRQYIGAATNIQSRVNAHLKKKSEDPSWVRRLAIDQMESGQWQHQKGFHELHRHKKLIREQCTAEALYVFEHQPDDATMQKVEQHFIDTFKPSLNKIKSGYKTNHNQYRTMTNPPPRDRD